MFSSPGTLALVFTIIVCVPSPSSSSVFDKGATLMRIIVENPGVPFCVQEVFNRSEYIDSFAYLVPVNGVDNNDDVELELSLQNESGHVLATKGPEALQTELQLEAKEAGLYTLCVATNRNSGRHNVHVMFGVFALTSPIGNDTGDLLDDALPLRVQDDPFGVMRIENLTHVATRVMLAINNAKSLIRQSALHLHQDTFLMNNILSTINSWSVAVSFVLILAALVQVHVLKRFFNGKERAKAKFASSSMPTSDQRFADDTLNIPVY